MYQSEFLHKEPLGDTFFKKIGNEKEGWIYTVKALLHLPEIENQLIALPSSVVISLSHLCFA